MYFPTFSKEKLLSVLSIDSQGGMIGRMYACELNTFRCNKEQNSEDLSSSTLPADLLCWKNEEYPGFNVPV